MEDKIVVKDGEEVDPEEEEAFDNFVKIGITLSKRHISRQLDTLRAKYFPLRVAQKIIKSNQRLAMRIAVLHQLQQKLSIWPDEFEQRMAAKLNEFVSHNSGYQELLHMYQSNETNCSCENEQCRDSADASQNCSKCSNQCTKESIDSEDTHSELHQWLLQSNLPLVAFGRGRYFPRYDQMIRFTINYPIPAEYMHIYSVIYCYQELLIRRGGVPHEKDRNEKFAEFDKLQSKYDHHLLVGIFKNKKYNNA